MGSSSDNRSRMVGRQSRMSIMRENPTGRESRQSGNGPTESGSKVRFSEVSQIQTVPRTTMMKRGRASVMGGHSVMAGNPYYLNQQHDIMYTPNRRGILKLDRVDKMRNDFLFVIGYLWTE